MTDIPAPMCIFCRHLEEGTTKCAAFPGGIPDAVLFGTHDHRAPIEGDRGIRFELKPGGEADLDEWLRLEQALASSCEIQIINKP